MQVKARQTTRAIEFTVENSVPPAMPEGLAVKKEGGIGLENLRRRLELLYPGKHTLLAERKGTTFIAALTIETD
jgi:LytS/YehU family sensor histidine kinase